MSDLKDLTPRQRIIANQIERIQFNSPYITLEDICRAARFIANKYSHKKRLKDDGTSRSDQHGL